MAYTDKELKDATQVAYAELAGSFERLLKKNPGQRAFTLEQLRLEGERNGEAVGRLAGLSDAQRNTWKLVAVRNDDLPGGSGLYCCVIETGPGEAIVAYRGSENMRNLMNLQQDWVGADLALLHNTATPQEREAERFLLENRGLLERYQWTATGHSLGGELAEYTAIMAAHHGMDGNFAGSYSFDGPGHSNTILEKYQNEIEKVSGKMVHYRWSPVGNLLNEIPGARQQMVAVEDKGGDKYGPLTRHDTKYLVFTPEGQLVAGKMDPLSGLLLYFSRGLDRLPKPMDDALLRVVSQTLYANYWIGQDETLRNSLVAGGAALLLAAGLTAGVAPTIAALAAAALVVATFVVGVALLEATYEAIVWIAGKICEFAAKAWEGIRGKESELAQAISQTIQSAKGWLSQRNILETMKEDYHAY
ncbi:MAG: DUF2974 domain-containing protein [Oscillospiraceae bacterium]|jgi:hypothetical protein|nr:DUF2974 domain-containing protein [Oscillospiraceae bacterium]